MAIEHETKVLDIDAEEIKKKLRDLGAEEGKEVKMRRWVFDMKPSDHDFHRLRDEGDKVTLCHKHRFGNGISETEEEEIEVEDFDKCAEILNKIPFEGKFYQENKRHRFILNDIEFCIDSWPKIPVLLEVESDSEEKVREGLKILGLEGKDIGNISVKDIFRHYKKDIHDFKELRF